MAKAVFAEVYEIVRLIPRGKVLTYGYISDMLEKRLSAQGVGWALNALSSSSSSVSSGSSSAPSDSPSDSSLHSSSGSYSCSSASSRSSSSSRSASGSSSSGSSSSSSSSASSCGEPYNSANVPWQRVVNVGGRFSTHKVRDGVDLSRLQRSLLMEEGVKFIIDPKDGQERIDMNECLWRPLS